MTEQLKTLMDRAAEQDFAAVDLDVITGAGDRTVRRRRVAGGIAGVAALAVAVTGALLIGGDDGDGRTDFVDDPFVTDVPMWTVGSTLHTPGRTFDLGVEVASFVRTSEGIVFLGWEDGDGEPFGVYSYTGEGEPARIGETSDSRLRADPAAPYAGWLDGAGEDVTAAIYDQSSGRRVYDEPTRLEYSFPVVAIDGTTAYLANVDEGPVLTVDLESGETTELPDSELWRDFLAAEGDLVARHVREGQRSAVEIGPPDAEGVVVDVDGVDAVVLSPGGDWVSIVNNVVSVFDLATGKKVPLDTQGFSDGLGYEWVDDDTLVVAGASEGEEEIALLTCDIPARSCTEVTPLPGLENGEIAAIGLGEVIWGAADEASGTDADVPAVTETVTVDPE